MSLSGLSDGSSTADTSLPGHPTEATTTAHRAFEIGCSYANRGEIGRGNMGAIIRAKDRDLNRDVALKVMLRRESRPEERMRFLREAQITGRLEHPNIVPVHALGTDTHGNPVFAMKLVHGTTLEEVIQGLARKSRASKEWTIPRLVQVLVHICNGVDFAHSKGVVHRDLKPSNIMLGAFGEVLVMDWGLAKSDVNANVDTKRIAAPLHRIMEERREGRAGYRRQHSQTVHGSVIGTPRYMSPEQARGEVDLVDFRSDIYGLGGLLYDMLALTPPVPGDDLDAILRNVIQGAIQNPELVNPRREIPAELSAIAMKALALEPRNRYQSVAEFRADLERWLEHRPVSAKEDNGWETLRKLFVRNRGSAAIAAVAGIVVVIMALISLIVTGLERAHNSSLLERLEQSEQLRQQVLHQSAPLLLDEAVRALNLGDLDKALDLGQQAVAADSNNPRLRLFLGQMLTARGQWSQAVENLEIYRNAMPNDTLNHSLLLAARRGQIGEVEEARRAAAEVFAQTQAWAMLKILQIQDQERLARVNQRIQEIWPQSSVVINHSNGDWTLQLGQVNDLEALRGLPLRELVIQDARSLLSLSPLAAMPLRRLSLAQATQLADLQDLSNSPLEELRITEAPLLEDLAPLAGLPLVSLTIDGCPSLRNLQHLGGLALRELVLRHCTRIDDYSPLVALPLRRLAIEHDADLLDIDWLSGLNIRDLSLSGCNVLRDVSALANLPLQRLILDGTAVTNLDALSGLPLRELSLRNCGGLHDIRALAGMPLTTLVLDGKRIEQGWEALEQMPTLTSVSPAEGVILEPSAAIKRYR